MYLENHYLFNLGTNVIYNYFDKIKDQSAERSRDILAAVKEGRFLVLYIESASACNQKCDFCGLHSGRYSGVSKGKGILSDILFRSSVEQLRNAAMHFKQINFHLHGEPLLNKNLPGMIRTVREYGLGDRLALNTNGTLLSREVLLKLVDGGIDEITISLDVSDASEYARFRGADAFEQVVRNIDTAIQEIEKGLDIEITVKCSHVMIPKHGLGAEHEQKIAERYRTVAEHSHKIHVKVLPEYTWRTEVDRDSRSIEKPGPCGNLFYQLVLAYDGRLSLCCIDLTETLQIGSLTYESLASILSGRKIRELRRDMLNGNFEHLGVCRSCDFRKAEDIFPVLSELKEVINTV